MSDISFSQNVVDAIGLIFTIGGLVIVILMIFLGCYYYMKEQKPYRELKKELMRLEIEKLKKGNEFAQSQAKLMEQKAKYMQYIEEKGRKEQNK